MSQNDARDASERHYKQAVEFAGNAERGEPMYELGNPTAVEHVEVPLTRDGMHHAAQTHLLFAIYFELRHQTRLVH